MPQAKVIRPFKTAQVIFVAGLMFLILGPIEVTVAQASAPPTMSAIKKFIYQVQTFKGGSDLIYGLPGGTRPATSDIYELVGVNVEPKKLVQGGENAAWSPRGDKIAYLGFARLSTEQEQYRSETTLQGTSNGMSRWYIEGTSLLARQIYVINADGSGGKLITNVPNGVWDFAWSPVEDKIAYCEQGKDGETAIVLVDADGLRRRELTKMGEIRCAVGMPILRRTLDPKKTMTSSKSGGGKVLMKLVGPQESTASAEIVTGELIGVPSLVWSPDGKFIGFTGVMNGKPVIGVVGKDGKAKALGVGYSVQWSPDGKRLLFRHDSDSKPPVTALCVVNADGTEPQKILDNEGADFGVAWFPDGKSVVFGSRRDTKNHSEIFRINVDGGGLQKIATHPNMSLSNPVLSPDGTKLIVDALHFPAADSDMLDFNLLLVDVGAHRQESLGKGSHASILWQHP
jgi:Tol biopolymer transport system component